MSDTESAAERYRQALKEIILVTAGYGPRQPSGAAMTYPMASIKIREIAERAIKGTDL